MNTIHIYNKNCLNCVVEDIAPQSIDCVVTSPPYGGEVHTNAHRSRTYDVYDDKVDVEAYNKMCVDLFNGFDRVLKQNGVVCWNVSYNKKCSEQFILALHSILTKTNFTIADVITWKKSTAMPIPDSPNRLARVCEHIYILVRRSDYETYFCGKDITSIYSKTGKPKYANVTNLIEAPNNNGTTELNGAVFSEELVAKLLNLYCPVGGMVYDPFMGTGTTAKACVTSNRKCVGSELSLAQCEYAKRRVDSLLARVVIDKEIPQTATEPTEAKEE